MGVRPGVKLPAGVEGRFRQYLDDYLVKDDDEREGAGEKREFRKWVFEELFEGIFKNQDNDGWKLGEVEVIGGLGSIQTGLDRLRDGKVSGRKLIILPQEE
jgi:hypothetical protein